jgi:hypothetical protein
MPFKVKCSLFLILFCATSSYAQKVAEAQRTPYSQQFGLEEGLPSQEVYNLLPCKDGRLLVSTDNGPAYFDGRFFYPVPNRRPLPLSPIFTHMVADENNRIWGNNFSNQLLCLVNDSIQLIQGSPLLPDEYWIRPIFKNGKVYFISTSGIFLLNDNLTYQEILRLSAWNKTDSNDTIIISALPETGKNSWLVSGSSFLKRIEQNNVINHWPIAFRQPKIIDFNDEIYIFECSDGADHYLKLSGDILKQVPLPALKSYQVFHPEVSGQFLWICTSRGLLQINKSGKVNSYFDDYSVSSVAKDKEGNFWVGTLENGLLKIPHFGLQVLDIQWLPNEKITRICKGIGNGVFAGTNRGRIISISPRNSKTEILITNRDIAITGLFFDEKQKLIFSNTGVFKWPEGEQLVALDGATKFIPLGNNQFARTLHVGVLFSNNKKANIRFGSFGNRILFRRTYDLSFRMQDSSFLAATSTGLVYLNTDLIEHEIRTEDQEPIIARHLLRISENWHLAGTDLQGIFLLHNYQPVRQWNKLFNQNMGRVKSLIRVANSVYVVFEEGFLRAALHLNKINYKFYPGIEGNPGIKEMVIFPKQYYSLIAGRLIEIPHDFYYQNQFSPELKIKRVLNGNTFSESLNNPVRLTNNKVEVEFELISFAHPSHYQLFYSLSPRQTYSIPSGSRSIQLPNLSGGTYQLEIYCIEKKTGARVAESGMTFIIPRPIYQQPVSLLFMFAFFFLGIYALFRWQRSVWQRKQQLSEQVLTSRLQTIRAQMNPHFLFNVLNAVQGFIYTNQKERASEYLGKFSNLMRQILHLSDKEWVSLEEDLDALEFYLNLENGRLNETMNYCIIKNISPGKWDIPPMLIQPLAENAVKHGLLHHRGTKVLEIELTENNENKELLIRVEDNGIGRKRSEEINKTRKLQHQPFATKAMETRISLLNQLGKVRISLVYTDKVNHIGQPAGTKVMLTIKYLV